MKNILFFLLIIISLGCTERETSVARSLTLAGGLMQSRPDSAYSILRGIDVQDIVEQADVAYYALLMTQARHKNYITLSSDSLINIAVEYYAERDRDRYALSLMYKGAALADMGLPIEAMNSYKIAEEHTRVDEYMTLGLLNIRMGKLYQSSYIDNDEQIAKYKRALHFFDLCGHTDYRLYCLSTIGQVYTNRNIDSALHYQRVAMELAKEVGDSTYMFHNLVNLSIIYYKTESYGLAKDLALYALNCGAKFLVNDDCIHFLCRSYAKLGKVDSALHYLALTREEGATENEIMKLTTMIEINKAQNDYRQAFENYFKSENVANSIVKNNQKANLYSIEKYYDKKIVEQENLLLKLRYRNNVLIVVTVMLISLIIIVVLVFIIRRHRRNLSDNSAFIERLKDEFEQNKNKYISSEKVIFSSIIDSKLQIINKLIEASYRYGTNTSALLAEFRRVIDINHLDTGVMNDLRELTNTKYDGLIDKLTAQYPLLKEDDVMLIAMICNGFPAMIMTIFFGYNNEKSIYNRKSRIAAKMGLDDTLDSFLMEKIRRGEKSASTLCVAEP